MSYKYRRQSIYLQRKSLSRGNSTPDPYDDWDGGANASATALAVAAANAQIAPPNLETMKVLKGFEFVTFTPVEVKPPTLLEEVGGSSSRMFSIQEEDENEEERAGSEERVPLHRSASITSSTTPTDTMVKSFNLERMPDNVVIDEIDETESRESLFAYVSNKFCYGTKAALQMTIRDMIHSFVFKYTLESFCEKRELCWTYEPYGAYLDSPDSCTSNEGSISCNQATLPENAWSIEVEEVNALNESKASSEQQSTGKDLPSPGSSPGVAGPSGGDMFQSKVINLTVPGTLSIHSCHNCGGVGRKRCITCIGSGSKTCQTCHGNGYYGYYHKSALSKTLESSDCCWRCHGRGRLRCYGCNGDGMTTCGACLGSGQIKCYIKLIVTLTNHLSSVLIRDHRTADLPLDLLQLAGGDVIFEEDGHNLNHISNFIDESITKESQRLIELHLNKYLPNSRLILQRHRIQVIPVAKVFGYWQRKQFQFYVFGSQRRCYTTNYPQRYSCSCCCVI